MNPSANPPEHRGQRSEVGGRNRRWWATCLLAVGMVAAGLVLFPGCKKHQPPPGEKDKASVTGDPWAEAGRRLQKDTDLAATKSALTHLNNELSAAENAKAPPPLAADAEKALSEQLGLGPADADE